MAPSSILIVEDEGIVALDLQNILHRLGYHVAGTADSGEEAIRLAQEKRPNLVLMDIRLKGSMDGVDTAHWLRKQFGIATIYLTAYADDTTLQRAKLTEPFGYLIKPFEERQIQSMLEMAFSKIEAEIQIIAQATRLEKIIATVPEGVALLDANKRIIQANAKAANILLLLAGAVVGDYLNQLGGYSFAEMIPTGDEEIWREIVSDNPSRRVFEMIVKSVTSNSVHDEAGGMPSEWVLVIRDITLERRIQEKTRLLDRLAALGQFSAGIAHDFNNILASIILNTEIIQKLQPNMPAKIEGRLESITRQANRASRLIKQILDFSRASPVPMQPFDLMQTLKEQIEMLERMLPENIQLEISFLSDSFWVVGDPTRIQEVLMNLALNARDAMPSGGVLRVEVSRLSSQEADVLEIQYLAEWVRIQVADNGTGIHADVLARMFEPFFTTKGTGNGSGLGLAQVYGVVQQHGGHVKVDSQVGQGSTFSIYLPAVQQPALPAVGFADEPPTALRGDQQTILLVEDDRQLREALLEILEMLNYRVLAASNGHEALAVIEQPGLQVDLVLTDLVMPGMGGVELVRELRQRKNDVKIVVMTGYASKEAFIDLQELRISAYLNKPIAGDLLSKTFEEVLSV